MKLSVIFSLLMPLVAFGQISDNFEHKELSQWIQYVEGRWGIDSASPLEGRFSLHHIYDNPEAGADQAAVRLLNLRPSSGDTRWSFMVRHGCDPSSSNNWGIFLMSDDPGGEMHPGGKVNGFAAGVNLSVYDDTLRLWKIKNGSVFPVITTIINWQNDIGTEVAATLEINRSSAGVWSIMVSTTGGSQYGPFTGSDSELFRTDWFGIYYRYTSMRDRLFWFDNLSVEGTFIPDSDPPSIVAITPAGKRRLLLELDEEVAPGFCAVSNFILNDTGLPLSDAIVTGRTSFLIDFNREFINKGLNVLKIEEMCDLYSNCAGKVLVGFTALWAEPGDVMISEIMVDPSPPVSLPPKEYLEITSGTSWPLSLKGWTLSSEGQKSVFPDMMIRKGEYIILCSASDTSLFSQFGRVIGLKSFPALTDAGKCLVLSDSLGNMIHGVDYSDKWYGSSLKEAGGWSLEMIDTDYPFHYEGNWKASVSSKGGTPGKINSAAGVNRDNFFAGAVNVFPYDAGKIVVTFEEPVRNLEEYEQQINIDGIKIDSLQPADPLRREFIMFLCEKLQERKRYTFTIPEGVTDYAGNRAPVAGFVFGLPETVKKGDVVFNELLFNPLPGDARYIEFCNVSDKIIDVSRLSAGSKSSPTGSVSNAIPLSKSGRCLLPGGYYTITTDRYSVISRYFSASAGNIFNLSQFPSMPSGKGYLVLFNPQLDVIDEVGYSEKQHFSLLTGLEGVSLEKIRPEAPSSRESNWHSASEASGWGTPGAKNSICRDSLKGDGSILLSSSRITPGNDGYEDILIIDFRFPGTDNVVTVMVFDEAGNLVCKPAVNYFIGQGGIVIWDGTAGDGSLVRTGIYVIYISVFDGKGNTRQYKKICSVLR